ncbi:lipase family protein [Rhodocytophaga rosea]|uniref:Lipase family protein n=1 Tax=Rhodocytophaga rosea TaxID=2704465 RepID=A0A6C0GQ28_9BACT|nr:lipase family protein [Rhodocytophaga rosea]QHT69723.1 lipase family protein [Rhodocytophaga rosea]
MRIKLRTAFFACIFLISAGSYGQVLQPGFDKAEFVELLKVFSRWGDSTFYKGIPESQEYRRVYSSPIMGLENKWELLSSKTRNVALINLRGTTTDPVSWLENFYAAMVPASGSMILAKNMKFDYQLATNPRAAVHVGWLIGIGFLAADILPKMDSCYKAGTKDFIIHGHSQGGALAYLLTAHLYSLIDSGKLLKDIQLKTYCAAGPKPGNLYFAYDYEKRTMGGWAYNIVNSADWVPEVPISIQTVNDFNQTNPFVNARKGFKKEPLARRVALNHVYSQLTKHTLRAQRRYQKYLGKTTSRFVKSHLKDIELPKYVDSNHYVRTGNFIVLEADETYYKQFPDSETKVFTHHLIQPYLYLTEKLK